MDFSRSYFLVRQVTPLKTSVALIHISHNICYLKFFRKVKILFSRAFAIEDSVNTYTDTSSMLKI